MPADAAMVLVPLPNGRALALDVETYRAALERGRELVPDGPTPPREDQAPDVRDAAGMEALTDVPASWWAEAARRGDVPSLQCGKYRRFIAHEALEALKVRR